MIHIQCHIVTCEQRPPADVLVFAHEFRTDDDYDDNIIFGQRFYNIHNIIVDRIATLKKNSFEKVLKYSNKNVFYEYPTEC